MSVKTTYQTGLIAEVMAAWMLRLKGYHVIARRYKTPVGEIDIIARRKDVLVFAEVKARKALDDALESVTPTMRKRITRAAEWFISQNPQYAESVLRFDLVACAPPFSVRHLDNAWQADHN